MPHIFHELLTREENEVIADVTDLPSTDVFETDGNRTLIGTARDMMRDPAFDPIAYMKRQGNWGFLPCPPIQGERYVPPPPGPTEEQVKHLQWLNKLLLYVREFFATPWKPVP